MPDSVFGPLISGGDVERAALETLKLWTPAYLGWAERLKGLPTRSIPAPRSWVTTDGVERWAEEDPPSVLLVSPGLAGPPDRDGRKGYRAHFSLGLAVVVKRRERPEELAKLYVATLSSILLHKPSLGGLAEGVDWLDERYDVIDRKRQLAAGQAVFSVEVRDVRGVRSGPGAPPSDPYTPYPDPPLVGSTEVVVEAEEDPSP